jgi:NAD(P)-dependent dehydrogenase (short-subunit alcohol dehydrogenase family)
MREFEGKTAIVTGAASGIGLGLARTFARHGMALVLCDIRKDRLETALQEVRELGARAIAMVTDVSDRTSVEAAGRAAVKEFGAVHIACNNAGVAMHGKPIAELSAQEWDWVIGVNIHGVINGMQVFLPLIRAQGGEGYIVNTASIGGFQVRPGWHTGAYSMTKYAVVALTEALAQDLAGMPIGVSVLCPGAVNTNIYGSAANRPERLGGPYQRPENHFVADLIKDGLAPDDVGERVMRAMRENEFFVFTDADLKPVIDERHQRIMDAMDESERWIKEHFGSAQRRAV